MRVLVLIFTVLLIAAPLEAKEIAGVNVEEKVVTDTGKTLLLNGAGIRKKFFFKIYIAELYLENAQTEAQKAIADEGSKRIVMHFLYDEVGEDKLVEGWNEGFTANNSAENLKILQPRIDAFNAMFNEALHENEDVVFDYLPGTGTQVKIKGKVKGVIEGKDFNDALLSIWLGEKPVGSDLKKELLQP